MTTDHPRARVRLGLGASVLSLALAAGAAFAQPAPAPTSDPVTAPAPAVDPSLFQALHWRGIGPYRGGRALAVAGVESEPGVYYFGAAAGGVWKSTDSGATWSPIFDKAPNASIGAIAVAPSNPNILYVGTGEGALRGDITWGDGVWKSTDAGKTWTHIGLSDTRQIGALIVDPTNPDVVLVAAEGHAFGPNAARGVFRTADGGKTWTKVLYKDENTGAVDVTFDPTNPRIVYAALWQARRLPWNFSSGGPGSGLYRSTDGGLTWTQLTGHGLPDGLLGRIDVSVSKADPKRVYAMIEAEAGGLYRSDDAGQTWTRVSDDGRIRQRAWYFSKIYADPKAVDTVYALNTGMLKSTDGGKTWGLTSAPHGDHHALWINPSNPRVLINSSDGGASVTLDGGKTWSSENNQPTAQFYHVAVDERFPYWVYGAQQDNSNLAVASFSDAGVIGPRDWYPAGGGESGFVVPDPRNANIIYSDAENSFSRYLKSQEQVETIS
ncbi:MAG: glycosyl hydrolase, partial [Alphaproteobacteria bacterium]|nr:glycosyl hydrolase [Alphaproteobacteria bacterium]